MNVKSTMKFAGVVAVMALAAACSSTKSTGPDVAATDNANSGVTSGAVTPGSQDDLEQNVGHRVFFGYDQYSLSAQAQSTLQRQAEFLKQYSNVRIQVSGNCDERGTREYNLALGDRRAYAVKEFLVSLGVDAARLQTKSYGKERPVCAESDDSCWQQNRRGFSVISAGAGS